MIKNKKAKFIILSIVAIIIIGIILTFFNNTTESSMEEEKNATLSEEKKEEIINDLDRQIAKTNNDLVVEVNDEKITRKQLEFAKWQERNKIDKSNLDASDEAILNKLIKECVMYQDAIKNNINLSKEEENIINQNIDEVMNKNDTELTKIANALELSNEQFLNMYKEKIKRAEIISKWKITLADKINTNELKIEDNNFREKYEKYNEEKDDKKRYTLLLELINSYIENIIKNATIIYH